MIWLIPVLALTEITSLVSGDISPFYLDDGMGHTVGGDQIPHHEIREIGEELLHVMGLQRRPRPQGPSVSSSASQFLLDIYSQTVDMSNGLMKSSVTAANIQSQYNITSWDREAADQSDTIMSFSSPGNPLYQQLPYKASHLLWFDLIEVPSSGREITAHLRVYHNFQKSFSKQPFSVIVHQVMRGENGVPNLHPLHQLPVAADHTGWLLLNVTSAADTWTMLRDFNLGLYIQVLTNTGSELTMADVGLADSNDIEDYHPFLTVFIKYHNGHPAHSVVPRPQSVASRRAKRNARKSRVKVRDSNGVHPLSNALRFENHVCQRQNLFVNFKNLGWSDWIIAPEGYAAFYCTGLCEFPLNSNMNATNHAIVQTLTHLLEPFKYPKPQCAPTQLTGISVLFYDDGDNVTLRKYKNMVAISCGCQ